MTATRDALHRVATHVLARARHAATGRIGLRATPGGFGTPAFGEDVTVVRIAGGTLVHERGGDARTTPLDGATLAGLASFVGVDLDAPFSAGADTPAIGDRHAPLAVDGREAAALAAWWDLGWRALDAVVAEHEDLPASVVQLWPEHFDAACAVATGAADDDRCNLGVSPGDAFSDEPYLYVGPWRPERPGDASFWNAPFGAVMRRPEVTSSDAAAAFLRRGLALLRSGGSRSG